MRHCYCLVSFAFPTGWMAGGLVALSLLLDYPSRYHRHSNGHAMTLYLFIYRPAPPAGSFLLAGSNQSPARRVGGRCGRLR